jgi:hypothetical protein
MAQSVFLIHDVLEKPFARQLAIDLSLAGATVWLDEAKSEEIQDILNGKIDAEIRGDIYLAVILSPDSVESNWVQHEVEVMEIRGDIYLAVILSPDSVESNWVQHEVEVMLNRGEAGLNVNVLPLLYKDCEVPAFMADKICSDFRNPENYTAMLHRIIDRLEIIGHDGKGPVLPDSVAGMWQGTWIWCGRQRDADLFLSASPVIPSRMVIRYMKSGILTIVEQELDVRISGKAVKLIGTGYRLIERGISLGWNLDTFNLSLGEAGTTLEGITMDKRGAHSPVVFKRK